MTAKKTVKKSAATSKKKLSLAQKAAQEALQVTFVLMGHLKRVRIQYIIVATELAQVRDRKLYAALKHPDIEDYAEKRLRLGRASLYKYLQVYDWVAEFHKEWLEPNRKGFIPELTDVSDLMWIEHELARKGLSAAKRAALEKLRDKALNGTLRDRELDEWRKKDNRKPEQSLKSFLSKFRLLRKRSSEVKSMPAEAISHLDSAIEIIRNALNLLKAGLDPERGGE